MLNYHYKIENQQNKNKEKMMADKSNKFQPQKEDVVNIVKFGKEDSFFYRNSTLKGIKGLKVKITNVPNETCNNGGWGFSCLILEKNLIFEEGQEIYIHNAFVKKTG